MASNYNITCPFCCAAVSCTVTEVFDAGGNGDWTKDCGSCGKTFGVTAEWSLRIAPYQIEKAEASSV